MLLTALRQFGNTPIAIGNLAVISEI